MASSGRERPVRFGGSELEKQTRLYQPALIRSGTAVDLKSFKVRADGVVDDTGLVIASTWTKFR
jgi:hypothetical protein